MAVYPPRKAILSLYASIGPRIYCNFMTHLISIGGDCMCLYNWPYYFTLSYLLLSISREEEPRSLKKIQASKWIHFWHARSPKYIICAVDMNDFWNCVACWDEVCHYLCKTFNFHLADDVKEKKQRDLPYMRRTKAFQGVRISSAVCFSGNVDLVLICTQIHGWDLLTWHVTSNHP